MNDDVPSVEQISYEVYSKFAFSQQHVVKENPICQKCNKQPSVNINRWGKILACCQDCLNKEQEDFNRYCEEQDKINKELENYY